MQHLYQITQKPKTKSTIIVHFYPCKPLYIAPNIWLTTSFYRPKKNPTLERPRPFAAFVHILHTFCTLCALFRPKPKTKSTIIVHFYPCKPLYIARKSALTLAHINPKYAQLHTRSINNCYKFAKPKQSFVTIGPILPKKALQIPKKGALNPLKKAQFMYSSCPPPPHPHVVRQFLERP